MEAKEIPSFEEINLALESKDDAVRQIHQIALGLPKGGIRHSLGFPAFDVAMGGGVKAGNLVIISGVSGEGKTTLAQTLTYHFTKKSIPCLWFSYEMPIEDIDQKFLDMGIQSDYLAFSPEKNTTGRLDWIKEKIIEGDIKHGTKIVFIDHIDFLSPMNIPPGENRESLLKNITIQLKSLAVERRVVIFLLAHVKKLTDGKEPDMQDIGYSAGIFQLADYVFMVSRERLGKREMGKADSGDTVTNYAKVKIVKNRQTGRLIFHKLIHANGKFNEPAKPGDEDLYGIASQSFRES